MKSKNEWVIAIDTKKAIRIIAERDFRNIEEVSRVRRIAAIKLICIPGIRPVSVPAKIPNIIAIPI